MGLLDGGFVRKHESVIFVGKPGTGKTHLAISLGVAACQAGLSTRFYTAASLAKVKAEWDLVCLCHNLRKLHLAMAKG
jgi:DNA replication protein DnaC